MDPVPRWLYYPLKSDRLHNIPGILLAAKQKSKGKIGGQTFTGGLAASSLET